MHQTIRENMDNIFDDLLDEGTKVETQIQPENKTEPEAEQEIRTEENKTEQPLNFDYVVFNKKFGGEWDEDKIKGILEKGSKYDEVSLEKDSYLKRVSELEALEDKINPLSHFSSEESYLREQLLIKNKDADPQVLNVLTNLSPSKIKDLSDFDALVNKTFIDNPDIDGGIEGVKELILDRFGLSAEELSEGNLDTLTKNKIKLEAKLAKSGLEKMYDGIEVPKKADLSQTRTVLKESWAAPIKEIVKGIDKLSLAEGFDFTVTDEMKQGLAEEYLSEVSNGLIKPSEETASVIAGKMRSQLRDKYFDKIIQTVQADAREKAKAEMKAEVHNTKPLNEQTRTTSAGQQLEDLIDKW